jgi:hypothetical protein
MVKMRAKWRSIETYQAMRENPVTRFPTPKPEHCQYDPMKLRNRDPIDQRRTRGSLPSGSSASRSRELQAMSGKSYALGALALGAIAIGAVAIGALVIGRLAIGRAKIRRLEIDDLVVRRLHVTEDFRAPPVSTTPAK